MASISMRGPSQWQAKIRRIGPDGHPITRSKTFETHEAARAWAAVMEGRIAGSEYVDRSRELRSTLKELLERYEKEETPRKKGAKQEINRLRAWAREEFAAWPVTSIEPATIAEWIAAREGEGKAPTTISNAVNLLSAVFKTAIGRWGYKLTNPCLGVPRPKGRPARVARLTDEQEARLLAECAQGPGWLKWIVRLQLETGMRQGEVCGLRWADIHSHHIHLGETKNGSERDVPLTLAAASVIKEMKKGGIGKRQDGFVFFGPELKDHRVSISFRRAADRAGLFDLTNHDLRHVAVTRLAELHDNVLELSATTGHKTLSSLKRYYNPSPTSRARAIREREKKLKKEKSSTR